VTTPTDAEPLGVRYQRQAKAATDAASAAVHANFGFAGGTEATKAKILAVGRIAAALILADQPTTETGV
jgi:hypothetical protein